MKPLSRLLAHWSTRGLLSCLAGIWCLNYNLGSNVAVGVVMFLFVVLGLVDPDTMLILGLVCVFVAMIALILDTPGSWTPSQRMIGFLSEINLLSFRPLADWMASTGFETISIGVAGILYGQIRKHNAHL